MKAGQRGLGGWGGVIQIETLKNVKYVPAKELVPAIIKITVYYIRVYSRSYVDS